MARRLPGNLSDVHITGVAAALHFGVALLLVLLLLQQIVLQQIAQDSVRWGYLVLVVGGTVAAAATGRSVALERSVAEALRTGIRGHGAAAVITFIVCAGMLIVPRWDPRYRSYLDDVLARALPLFIPQLVLGSATAALLRALTGGVRNERSTWSPEMRLARERAWKQEATLAAAAVICFLVVYAVPRLVVLQPMSWSQKRHLTERAAISLLLWLIPVVTGSLAALFMAGGLARSRLSVALTSGLRAHALGAAAAVAIATAVAVIEEARGPLSYPLRGSFAAPQEYAYSLMRFVHYGGPVALMMSAIVQTVLGTIAGCFFWLIARRLAPRPR